MAKPKLQTKYMTVLEIAIELNLSEQAVRYLCRDGAFHGAFLTRVGPGARWRIPRDSYRDYLDRRAAATEAQYA